MHKRLGVSKSFVFAKNSLKVHENDKIPVYNYDKMFYAKFCARSE